MIRTSTTKRVLAIWVLLITAGCASANTAIEDQNQATEPPVAPTATPTPGIEYDPPSFFSIPDQLMLPDEEVLNFDLTEYIFRVDPALEDVRWRAESDPALSISFDGPLMQIKRLSPNWLQTNLIQIEACNPGNQCSQTEMELNVIGNIENRIFHTQVDGILIESGGAKIMIDALFNNPWGTNNPKILQAMREAAPPYDNIDLILFTHQHADHFDAELAVQNMIHNPGAILLSTQLVVELLAAEDGFDKITDRVIGLPEKPGMDEIVNLAGVEIEVIYLSHGSLAEVPNFGYLFTLDGRTYFHTGDVVLDDEPLSTFINYGLPEKNIDLAFVPYFMLTNPNYFPYASLGIAPELLVPVHVSSAEKQRGYLFETMEEEFDNLLIFEQDFDWYPLAWE